jgi:hypothetical protein
VLLVLLDFGVGGPATDQPLDGEDGVVGVGDGLPLGGLAHQALVVGEGDDGGVVRAPSAFSITRGCDPSMIATQEFVVPRSIPMTLAMLIILSSAMLGGMGPFRHPIPHPMDCPGRPPGAVRAVYKNHSKPLQADRHPEARKVLPENFEEIDGRVFRRWCPTARAG